MENILERKDAWKLIPITGNEYPEHRKAKVRIAWLMTELGFKNIEFEKQLPIYARRQYQYAPVDVYGEYGVQQTKLAINIDGKIGHNSINAFKKTMHRKKVLKQDYGIILKHIPVGNLDDDMPDDVIKAELLESVLR